MSVRMQHCGEAALEWVIFGTSVASRVCTLFRRMTRRRHGWPWVTLSTSRISDYCISPLAGRLQSGFIIVGSLMKIVGLAMQNCHFDSDSIVGKIDISIW